MIPSVDLSSQHRRLRGEIDAAIARVLDREWYILGPEVEAFERGFAAYCGARHCIAVGNGTDALQLALRALAIAGDGRVATVPNAGGYATTAILQAGAAPHYVDVDPDTLLIDIDAFAAAAVAETATDPQLRAVVVTHLYGRMADTAAIAGIAREHGIAVIEDCAQAHGARRGGKMAGTLGDIGCFSFYPTKNLGALGDAGALVTDDDELARRLRSLRTYGWSSKYHCANEGGSNSRMDELQAAVLSVKLPHLNAWNARRRDIARRYEESITNAAIMLPPPASDDVVHQYVVRSAAREALRAHLASAGVASDIHYPVPDHRQPAWAARWDTGPLDNAELACERVLSLPCHPGLDDAQVDAVAVACNGFRDAR
ncbi:MAG: DegT/DnrJ/EryC1/StrS family aminotransferase [Betaproteobacteria bacterium]